MALSKGEVNTEYTVKKIDIQDKCLIEFLFSLGFYEGEKVTLISKLASNVIINIKDARYSFDQKLAERIWV